jgi:Protein of unknown function (DUF1376)
MIYPLVPPEVDLRDFAYMPLDVLRLRDSDLAAEATDAEFRAAVMLWCASWHQLPAASLPDNDAVLTRLSGFGRDIDGWKSVRSGALRGWVKCDDGRLYHPVVAEKANEAWGHKQKQRARTAAARAARLSHPPKTETTEDVTTPVTENVTASKGTERNGTEEEIINPNGLIVDAAASPTVDLNFERDRKRLAEDREKLRALGEQWNAFAGELRLPRIEEIEAGSKRERAAIARIREGRDFDRVFAKIRGSPFLRGDKGSTPASFDWITNPTNYLKIVEGNYDEVRQAQSR